MNTVLDSFFDCTRIRIRFYSSAFPTKPSWFSRHVATSFKKCDDKNFEKHFPREHITSFHTRPENGPIGDDRNRCLYCMYV